VLQVASAEFGSPISACSSLALAIEGVCSEPVQTLWSRLSRGGGLAFAVVIVLLFALCLALVRLVFRLFKRKAGPDESDYWRIHGDGG
jgi:hypothetical protein